MTKLSAFLKQPKLTSSAVFFTNGNKVLIVKPTNWTEWEIPKGTVDKGESPKAAAVREFKEETNVKLKPGNLEFIGKFNLHKLKDIMLFLYRENNLPLISSMKCASMFTDKKGKKLPEINTWRYIDIKDMKFHIRDDMIKMANKVREKLFDEIA